VIYAGKIQTAKANIAKGTVYNVNLWNDFEGDVGSLGIPTWSSSEVVVKPTLPLVLQRVYRGVIYQATANSTGIEPGVDPDWEDYWEEIVYEEGINIPFVGADMLVKVGNVYEFAGVEGEFAKHGWYRAVDQTGTGLKSFFVSDFEPMLEDGWFSLRLLKNPSGGGAVTSVNTRTGAVTLAKSDVGLSNVDNTTDLNKPVSTAQQTALDSKADLVSGKVPSSQLPSYVDDVLEFANLAAFPGTGETGKIYVALDSNLTYRWTGSVYGVLDPSLALGESSTTAYRGDRGKTAYDHSQNQSSNMETDKASTSKWGSIKLIYDWAVGLFLKVDITLTKSALGAAITASTIDVKRAYVVSNALSSNDNLIRLIPLNVNTFYLNAENLTTGKAGRYVVSQDWFIPIDNNYIINPTTSEDENKGYAQGDIWINTITLARFIHKGSGIWNKLSGKITLTNSGDIELVDKVSMFNWSGNVCNFSIAGNVTVPDTSSAVGSIRLEINTDDFYFLEPFAFTTDAIMTVDIDLTPSNRPFVRWRGVADTSTRGFIIYIERTAGIVSEEVPISITGQFFNNPPA
jgi:hypothetical protein